MPHFTFEQPIKQLEKRKGGYYYLTITADIVGKYEKKRATRLQCIIDQKVSFSCGLNHLGDGKKRSLIYSIKVIKLLIGQRGNCHSPPAWLCCHFKIPHIIMAWVSY